VRSAAAQPTRHGPMRPPPDGPVAPTASGACKAAAKARSVEPPLRAASNGAQCGDDGPPVVAATAKATRLPRTPLEGGVGKGRGLRAGAGASSRAANGSADGSVGVGNLSNELAAEIREFIGLDSVCISVLGGRFAGAYNARVRAGSGKNDGSFNAWLKDCGFHLGPPLASSRRHFCSVRAASPSAEGGGPGGIRCQGREPACRHEDAERQRLRQLLAVKDEACEAAQRKLNDIRAERAAATAEVATVEAEVKALLRQRRAAR